MLKLRGEYFRSGFNVADFVVYTLCLIVVLLSVFQVNNDVARPIATICIIFLWMKMLTFLRVFDTTSRLIRMIFEIVGDMGNFMIVLVIGLFAFTCGFVILQ